MRRVVHLALALTALAGLTAGAVGDTRAATIENISTLRYERDGRTETLTSNKTTLDTAPPRDEKPELTFHRYFPGSKESKTLRADGAQCKATSGAFGPVQVPAAISSIAGSAEVVETRAFHAGETVFVRIKDTNRNANPLVRDLIDVTIRTSINDEEELRLQETDVDSGVFAGVIKTVASTAIQYNCELSVASGTEIRANYTDEVYKDEPPLTADALVDPYGFVFSTEDNAPINGATVRLYYCGPTAAGCAAGMNPPLAEVFGDAREPYPNTVVTGRAVTTGAGEYAGIPGGYRFPLVREGFYKLDVTTPSDYRVPSTVLFAQLGDLTGPDGLRYTLVDGSRLNAFGVFGEVPIKIDVPVDPLRGSLVLAKTTSTTTASQGDFIQYSINLTNRNRITAQENVVITDTLPVGFRYRSGSLRVGGAKVADPEISADGRVLRIALPTLAPGASVVATYVTQVGAGTPDGDAVNEAVANTPGGLSTSNAGKIAVRIRKGFFADSITIVGRIVEGQCDADPKTREGVPGVRVLLDDGTYVVTDRNGQYHFEGVKPGIHVVQMDVGTVPPGYEAVDCLRNTRTAGRAFSQFVDAKGGAMWRADFFLRKKAGAAVAPASTDSSRPTPPATGKAIEAVPGTEGAGPRLGVDNTTLLSDVEAAGGGDIDWLAGQEPGTEVLFPKPGHNPRSPATRVVVKHLPTQKVALTIGGKPADPLAFDGTKVSADGRTAVSIWRGLPLVEGENLIRAVILGPGGKSAATLDRIVNYSNTAAHAIFVPERSKLVADGVNRPVIAVRITDKVGAPVRAGVSGPYRVLPPYRPATEVDRQQERQLAGMDRFDPTFRVVGDDGVALIELQPTTQTGTVNMEFDFQVDRITRKEELRAWLEPGKQDWVVVGFAAGTAGFNTLARNSDKLADTARDETYTEGQVKLYAKGRVLGKWLMTLAYDNRKDGTSPDRDRRLHQSIDPQELYTVYGDGSQQGYDAASTKKLYLRLERSQFYAMFGDYETGLNESELGRYNRSLTGVKTEYRGKTISVNAFAADTDFRFARDEIQGNGLSGPYNLSRRDLVLNSEKVTIEVRDRFRSERIVESRSLARHIDYDVDYNSGTLLFRQPILSRDRDLNPIFIVVDYETLGIAKSYTNAGGRVGVEVANGRIKLGVTALHDESSASNTELGAVDARIQLATNTEVRLEAARSDGKGSGNNEAYSAQVQHRSDKVDAVAYYRQQDASFGVGQLNRSEDGTRKYGVDGRVEVAKDLNLIGSLYREEYFVGDAQRTVGDAQLEYRNDNSTLRAGTLFAKDRTRDGDTLQSNHVQLSGAQRLMGGKLELNAETQFALGGKNDSVDFPTTYRTGGSYAITPDVRLVANHEITDGADFNSQTTQVGLDAVPWKGSRVTSTLNQQDVGENGQRSFAALGLSQAFLIGERWGIDVSLDGSRTFNGDVDFDDVLNPHHPVSAGGYLGTNSYARKRLSEDFWAFSTGFTYRSKLWSLNSRLEYRSGGDGDRYGLAVNLLRQVRDGIALSFSAQAFRTTQYDGSTASVASVNGSVAYRPVDSSWSILNKLEVRTDKIENGVMGAAAAPAAFGNNTILVNGDAQSWRVINNFVLNYSGGGWSPEDRPAEQRAQLSLYYGSKYVLTRFDVDDYSGYTDFLGLETRFDVTSWLDIGLQGTVGHAWSAGTWFFSGGPSVGITPFQNIWLSLGYNLVGFRDRDFEGARYTRQGFYVTMRMKFDQQTTSDLGLTSMETKQ